MQPMGIVRDRRRQLMAPSFRRRRWVLLASTERLGLM
jgi:hypothetical protein